MGIILLRVLASEKIFSAEQILAFILNVEEKLLRRLLIYKKIINYQKRNLPYLNLREPNFT